MGPMGKTGSEVRLRTWTASMMKVQGLLATPPTRGAGGTRKQPERQQAATGSGLFVEAGKPFEGSRALAMSLRRSVSYTDFPENCQRPTYN
jgi:hypothetical protein